MADYAPVLFTKGAETRVAYTRSEYNELLYDGWRPGALAPEPERDPSWAARMSDLTEVDEKNVDITDLDAAVTSLVNQVGPDVARETLAADLANPVSATSVAVARLQKQIETLDRLRAQIRNGLITTARPFVPIGDSHTDDITASQYLWDDLQAIYNQPGEGLEGVPAAAIVPRGHNGSTLLAYRNTPALLQATLALKPSVTMSCWLTNDVREGGLGLTVAAIRVAGAARLAAHIADIKASPDRPDFIILRVPAPYTTVDAGQHYIKDAVNGNWNPAGLAQIYTDGVRLAHYDVLKQHPDVLLYDPQTRVFGTTSPTSNTGDYGDQIHQSAPGGYKTEAKDMAAWFGAAKLYQDGLAVAARLANPTAPWTVYSRTVEDPARYTLVAEALLNEDVIPGRTFARFGPMSPGITPGAIQPGDIIQFVGGDYSLQVPSGSGTIAQVPGLVTQLTLGSGVSIPLNIARATRVRVWRRRQSATDTAFNAVLDDPNYRIKYLGNVNTTSGAPATYVDIEARSTTAAPPKPAAEWSLATGDQVYVEGQTGVQFTIGTNCTPGTSGANVRLFSLPSVDRTAMVGKLVVIVGNHAEVAPTKVNTVAAAGAATTIPDPAAGTVLSVLTLSAATCAIAFPEWREGKTFDIALIQDATGGRLVTWAAGVRWPGGTAPTLTTGADKRDLFRFRAVDGNRWYGQIVGQNYSA